MFKLPKIIVLVGPKNCGKSIAAFILRDRLQCRGADLDSIIEKRTGKSPRELYLEGPEVFRHEEAEKLHFVLKKELCTTKETSLVLATGGGIIDNQAAVDMLIQFEGAVIICLELNAETAWRRIEKSGDGLPPFLAEQEDPQAAHCALHTRRTAACKEIAHVTINVDDKQPNETADAVIEYLKTRN